MLELDSLSVAYEIHEEHAADEAHGSENTDWREVLDRIFPIDFQGVICYGIGYRDGWHIERHAESVKGVEDAEFQVGARLCGVPAGAQHEQGCKAVAEGEYLLCRNPFIRNNTCEGRHENGDESLRGKEKPDLRTESGTGKETAH